MKVVLNLLLGTAILFSFSQCGASKNNSYQLEKTPFLIEKSVYVDWVAGVRGGGSGTNVIIEIKNLKESDAKIKNIYFRKKKVEVEINNTSYIGRFKKDLNQKDDLVLHKDPKKEFGNQVPIIESDFPFDLENDETVISYLEKGKLKFHKIKLEKGKDRIYE